MDDEKVINWIVKKFNLVEEFIKELTEYGNCSNNDLERIDMIDSLAYAIIGEYCNGIPLDIDMDKLKGQIDKAMNYSEKKAIKYCKEHDIPIKKEENLDESKLRKVIKKCIKEILDK